MLQDDKRLIPDIVSMVTDESRQKDLLMADEEEDFLDEGERENLFLKARQPKNSEKITIRIVFSFSERELLRKRMPHSSENDCMYPSLGNNCIPAGDVPGTSKIIKRFSKGPTPAVGTYVQVGVINTLSVKINNTYFIINLKMVS